MSYPVQVPADVEREDTVLGPLTARQVVIVLITAAVLYGLWRWCGPTNLLMFALSGAPVALIGLLFTVGRRDGLALDRLLVAALRQRAVLPTAPRPARAAAARAEAAHADSAGANGGGAPAGVGRLVAARLPVRGVRATGSDRLGVVDLGGAGSAVVCAVSPLNLALRSGPEQDAAVGGFARWLHSLSGPVQLLTRTRPLDLSGPIARLRRAAPGLGHPALARAALAHAAHLRALDAEADLLHREFLIVFRDPAPSGRGPRADTAAAEALRRRAADAAALLGPLGLRVTTLTDHDAAAALRRATAPATALPAATPTAAPPRAEPLTTERPATEPPMTGPPMTGPRIRGGRREPGLRAGRADLDPPTVPLPPWTATRADGPPAVWGDDLDHDHYDDVSTTDISHDTDRRMLGGHPR